ncbi:MAG: ORF6N domain-containing protein [Bacteroidaceae bacterium]|nr:ORF6N domain-containing protein [Bacteroidaceae bacterium]
MFISSTIPKRKNKKNITYYIPLAKNKIEKNLGTVCIDSLKKLFTRNIERFLLDFMFQLTKEEWDALRFQNGIINIGRGTHTKYLAHVSSTRHYDRSK